MNRLKEKYHKEIVPALCKQFQYDNIHSVPRVTKVTVNTGIGRIVKDDKLIKRIELDLAKITGQKASVRNAKKSIAGFKLREGTPVGYMVTLRGTRMYDFIDRLISLALPRTRDFQGLSSDAFDHAGNLSIGIKEHNIFPEVSYESLKDIFGLQITVVTSAGSKEKGLALLMLMGFPIKS
ncbi:MAG: 50S ribosomal protein L5 [Patescibacteria group bacterium]